MNKWIKIALLTLLVVVAAVLAVVAVYTDPARADDGVDTAWGDRVLWEALPPDYAPINENWAFIKPVIVTDLATGTVRSVGIKIRPVYKSDLLKSPEFSASVYSRVYPKRREKIEYLRATDTLRREPDIPGAGILGFHRDGQDFLLTVKIYNLTEGSGQVVEGMADYGTWHRIVFAFKDKKVGVVGGYLDIFLNPDGSVRVLLNGAPLL